MPDALYSLLWYPLARTFEATAAERPLPARDAVVLHRRHAPNLAMGAAYAEVGVDLLPPHALPAAGDGVGLLWLPIVPWRCLLATREPTGIVRVTDRPEEARDRGLSDVLVDLEVECSWTFDEVFRAPQRPDASEIAARLAAAHELAVDAIARITAHAPPARVWSPGGAS